MSPLTAPAPVPEVTRHAPRPAPAPGFRPFTRDVIDWARTEFQGVVAEHFYVHHVKDVEATAADERPKGTLVGWTRIENPAAVEAMLDAYDAGTLTAGLTAAARREILSLIARRPPRTKPRVP